MSERADALASAQPEAVEDENLEQPEEGEHQGEQQAEAETDETALEEGQPPEPTEDAIEVPDKFLTADGTPDAFKIAKAHRELERKLGETSKDRERLKKLEVYEKEAQQFRQFQEYLRQNQHVAQAMRQAAQGQVAKPQEAQEPEDVNERIRELREQGREAEAIQLAMSHTDEFKSVKDKLAQAEYERAQAELQREADEFRRNHVDDGLFNEHGEVADQELFDELSAVLKEKDAVAYKAVSFEEAHAIALRRAGRTTPKPSGIRPTPRPRVSKPPARAPKPKADADISKEEMAALDRMIKEQKGF